MLFASEECRASGLQGITLHRKYATSPSNSTKWVMTATRFFNDARISIIATSKLSWPTGDCTQDCGSSIQTIPGLVGGS